MRRLVGCFCDVEDDAKTEFVTYDQIIFSMNSDGEFNKRIETRTHEFCEEHAKEKK